MDFWENFVVIRDPFQSKLTCLNAVERLNQLSNYQRDKWLVNELKPRPNAEDWENSEQVQVSCCVFPLNSRSVLFAQVKRSGRFTGTLPWGGKGALLSDINIKIYYLNKVNGKRDVEISWSNQSHRMADKILIVLSPNFKDFDQARELI